MKKLSECISGVILIGFSILAINSEWTFGKWRPLPLETALEEVIVSGPVAVEYREKVSRRGTDVAVISLPGRPPIFAGAPALLEIAEAFQSTASKRVMLSPTEDPHNRKLWALAVGQETGPWREILTYQDCVALEKTRMGMVSWMGWGLLVISVVGLVHAIRKED